jgi:dienelactone hydrolase
MGKARVVYTMPGTERVVVRRGVPYRTAGDATLTMDIYTPPGTADDTRLPAVVFVFGYPDAAIEAKIGSKLKDVGQYVCWGQLAASSGLIAITYETSQPEADIHAVLAHIREHAAALGIDACRIGLWACSGNVPVALAALMGEPVRCAVLYYGYMLDRPGSHIVAEAARRVGFANPCRADAFDALPRDVPLFVVKAGRDGKGLNETIDHFVREARSRDVPLTLVDYAEGRHAFDIVDDSERSREIVEGTLAFLQSHLLVGALHLS